MYRIDNDTAVTPIPTPAAIGPNPNYFFTNGNPGGGIPATVVDADWANAVQEEICGVIEGAGLTLSKTTRSQLLQAIEVIAQKDLAIYTTSSSAANTYTATLTPAPAAYTAGMIAAIKFTNANTGAATINLNSLGAKTITQLDGTALTAGQIKSGMVGVLIYDGTNFQLINAAFSASVIQLNSYTYASDTGSANIYAVALSPALASYGTGNGVLMKAANTNTGSSTLNVNSLGTKNIKLTDGSNPYAGAILSGGEYFLLYDGTNFQLLNPSDSTACQNNAYTYATDTGTANAYAIAPTPAITAYKAGQSFLVNIANTNTGTSGSTINVSSLGTKSIVTANSSTLIAGQLITGMIARLVYNGTAFMLENPAAVPDQVTIYTSSSGTYTTPTGAISLDVEMIGGGGQGGNTSASPQSGGNGGNTTFGSSFLTANGGTGYTQSTNVGGVGGTATGGDINISGGQGGSTSQNNGTGTISQLRGGDGGNSFFACMGPGGEPGHGTGKAAAANSGSGSGGQGTTTTASEVTGGGGGAGGYLRKLITSPSASYSYSVGAGGNNGTSSSGAGGAGIIIVRAKFQ